MLDVLVSSSPGLESPEVERRAREAATALRPRSDPKGRAPDIVFVPGRIEVLGKHTDYAGGASLTCATEQGICLAAARRDDRRVVIDDLTRAERAELDLDRPDLGAAGDGFRIAKVVCRRLLADFGDGQAGADLAFSSDLPAAAGMSSSSALLTALFLGLAGAGRLPVESLPGIVTGSSGDALRQLLAGYLAAVERGTSIGSPDGGPEERRVAPGVGILGGSEDHTAILCSRRRQIGHYRYDPIRRLGSIPLPRGWTFALAVSGVHASKATTERAAYNRLSRLASAAAELWRLDSGRRDRHLAAAVAASDVAAVRAAIARRNHAEFGRDELLERFDQFVEEHESLVPTVARSLAAGDLEEFSRAVDRSQRLAEERLHNQVAETVFLARSAVELGAAAASAFGAGFGGSVWALMREADTVRSLSAWRAAYLKRFPERTAAARFLVSSPAFPARRLATGTG